MGMCWVPDPNERGTEMLRPAPRPYGMAGNAPGDVKGRTRPTTDAEPVRTRSRKVKAS